ncbi:Uncharacterized protein OBRU01_17306 [Operophtera brumata]|uniref:Nucleic-acid-binding protein from transposon X-element n=1 Tax=Operophtera brumata TaxID=104452 RepID=A0A0L7L2X0_OPEBR|nr:Uncharacterized protein OBRU01_17306 [Operophtera brumata]
MSGDSSQTSVQASTSQTTPKGAQKKLTQQVFHPALFCKSNTVGSPTTNPEINTQKTESQQPEWQKAPIMGHKKRKRNPESPSPPHTPTINSFTQLSVDITGDDDNPKKTSKPPPLILYGIQDITKLQQEIETTLSKNEYSIKIMTKDQFRVRCISAKIYKKLMSLVRDKQLIGHTFTLKEEKLMSLVRDKQLIGHTFTLKEEKCVRVVIKNLHHSTPHREIVQEIEKTGNKEGQGGTSEQPELPYQQTQKPQQQLVKYPEPQQAIVQQQENLHRGKLPQQHQPQKQIAVKTTDKPPGHNP